MSIPLRKAQDREHWVVVPTAANKPTTRATRAATREPIRASFKPSTFVHPPRYPGLPPARDYKPTRDNPGPAPTRFYVANEAVKWHHSIRETIEGQSGQSQSGQSKSTIKDDALSYAECGRCPQSVEWAVDHLTNCLLHYCDPDKETPSDLRNMNRQEVLNVLIEHSLYRLEPWIDLWLIQNLRERLHDLSDPAYNAGRKLCSNFKVSFSDSNGEIRKLKFKIDRQLYGRCGKIASILDINIGTFVVLMVMDSLRAYKVHGAESMDQSVEMFYSQLRTVAVQLGVHFLTNGGIPDDLRERFAEIFPWKV